MIADYLYNTPALTTETGAFVLLNQQFASVFPSSALLRAATWGLIGLFPRNMPSNINGWQPRMLLYFTVGDENSDADVKIKGGFIPKGTNWKINDFEISLTGGIK